MKRKIQAENTRQKLIDAAEILSKQKLLKDITVDDITTLAKVAKGSFYTYFKKKEDVLDAFMFKDFEILRNKALTSKKDFSQRLEEYAIEFGKAIEKSGKETCRSWVCANINNDIKLNYDEKTAIMLLEDADLKGELLKDGNILDMAKSFNAWLYGMMLVWAMRQGDDSLSADIKSNIQELREVLKCKNVSQLMLIVCR